jgi:nucleotide-binding universal stress UspA family protein
VNTYHEFPVVVGVRGDQPALLAHALGWAQLLDAPLRVVHAYSFPNYTSEPMTGRDMVAIYQDAAQAVIDAARRELGATGEVPVEFSLHFGMPEGALESESKLASVVVIGTDNVGWLARVLDGEVSRHVAAHSHAPVIVVPEGIRTLHPQDIVVTLDDGTSGAGPLQFAFEIAHRSGAGLRIIHVISSDRYAAEARRHRERIDEMLRPWTETYPGVRVSSSVTAGDPADECLIAASTSDLLVAGQPHDTRRWITKKPPVVTALLRTARCPVVIVPPAEDA